MITIISGGGDSSSSVFMERLTERVAENDLLSLFNGL